MDEKKAEQIAADLAAAAGVASTIPSPASVPLLLFAALEPIIGPELFKAFGALFHVIHHAPQPKDAASAVLLKSTETLKPYVDTTSLYGG